MSHLTPPSEFDASRGPKACVACARAKVKCDLDPGNIVCTRCRRLKKSCTEQTPGAHRRNKPGRISDVARLEQKLDGVAAMLATSAQNGGPSPSSQVQSSNPTSLSPIECVQHFIKDDEATIILDAFRADMAPYFPFVVIASEQTVHELRQLKPFLFMAVMTIGCRHDTARQKALAAKAREIISHKMLIDGEQSLDLLQGLLVFIAWYQVHARTAQLSNLTYLMMALLTDLGLNKPTSPRYKPALGSMRYYWNPLNNGTPNREEPRERTLEERRALLGGLYVTTAISVWAREMDPIKYSMYADECCRVLEQANEYPSDQHLVIMIRIMGMVGKIRGTLNPEDWAASTGMSAPLGACVRSFEAELEQIRTKLPTDTSLAGADFISIHYSFIKVFLYEVAVHDNIPSSRYGTFPITRLKMLFTCLDEIKRSFERFCAIPSNLYFNFTYFTWALLGRITVVLSKLCILTGDGWDPEYARSTLDFPTMVATIQMKLDEARIAAEQSQSKHQTSRDRNSLPFSVPELFTALIPKLQQWRDRHMYKASQLHPQSQSQSQSQSQATMPSPSGTDALPITISDEEFLASTGGNLFDFLDSDYYPQLI
ncbi:hypothetical protein A1O1_02375 [Capronia coronata CBS 617.96]|uniref:Zn(2)-C6 fungal-type domain-containing protein n=1 Tax=Capronia coronata CBS 617.96 TaxID=1182541 RepID=W9YM54_9EURO|nr:uncharacterized protein A1O1_02375 [Capronia coronata CBS 617.96]EXJ93982.1 hypothetical protein A1O1_02375 [Capronia coronata CBS 617.96]